MGTDIEEDGWWDPGVVGLSTGTEALLWADARSRVTVRRLWAAWHAGACVEGSGQMLSLLGAGVVAAGVGCCGCGWGWVLLFSEVGAVAVAGTV